MFSLEPACAIACECKEELPATAERGDAEERQDRLDLSDVKANESTSLVNPKASHQQGQQRNR
jgi:hypothetical protein